MNLYVRIPATANVVNVTGLAVANVVNVLADVGAVHAPTAAGTIHVAAPVSSSMVTSTLEQNPAVSVPAYGVAAAFAAAAHTPAVSVNVLAGAVPMFFNVTDDDDVVPGTATTEPPYLLIVAHVPAFAPIATPAVDKHVVAP